MRAIVQDRYGAPEDLEPRDVPAPTAGRGEVLVRVRAASLHADVWHTVAGEPYVLRVMGAGLRRPRHPIPGIDLAGVVEAVGAGASRFRSGDEVFGEIVSGNQWRNGGAFAEYAAVREDRLEPKPAGLSFEEAAAVPTSAMIALRALRHEGRVGAGDRVLVNGAGGGLGIFAVQISKAAGAEVTGVDDGAKLDVVRSAGADAVIDFRREDVTRRQERFDVILDVASTLVYPACRGILTPRGRYVLIGHDHYGATGHRWFGSLGTFARLLLRTPFTPHLPSPAFSPEDAEPPMATLSRMIADGAIRPVIDRTFPLEEVPAALRHLMGGGVTGKIVITI